MLHWLTLLLPQGGVISPLLANVYLNPLDHGVNETTGSQARMIRYADDFVIACRPGTSGALQARLQRWLWRKHDCRHALWQYSTLTRNCTPNERHGQAGHT